MGQKRTFFYKSWDIYKKPEEERENNLGQREALLGEFVHSLSVIAVGGDTENFLFENRHAEIKAVGQK